VVQGTGAAITGLPSAKQLWEHRGEPVEVPPSKSWKK
jgi:hypothetical protein